MRVPKDIDDAREQLKSMEHKNTSRAMGDVFDTIALRIALAEVDRLSAMLKPHTFEFHCDRPGHSQEPHNHAD